MTPECRGKKQQNAALYLYKKRYRALLKRDRAFVPCISSDEPCFFIRNPYF